MKKHKQYSITFYMLLSFVLLTTVSCNHKPDTKTGTKVEESIPTLDELAGEWMNMDSLRNMPSVNNFHGGLAITKDISSVELLTFPPFVQNKPSCKSFINGEKFNAQYSRWYPYQALRKANYNGVEVTSTTRMVFEKQGVLLHLKFKNSAKQPKNIQFKLQLFGKARKFNKKWEWGYPRVNDDNFDIKSEKTRCLIISDQKSSTETVYTFSVLPNNLTIIDNKGVATWDLTIPGNDSITLNYVMAIGDKDINIKKEAKQWAQNFEKVFQQAKSLWENRWRDVFTPDNKHFSGHLPTLVTDDSKLRRIYYMDIASTLQLYRTNLPKSNRVFATNGPEWGVTLMYFWNLEMWPTIWAMLEPASMKAHLKSWLSLDYHNCYAEDYLSGQESGPWYSANDWSIFRCIDGYLRVTGDKKFLDEVIAGKTVLKHLEGLATNYRKFVRKDNILADYGGANNLLECVPTYINRVPSFNAANVWMLRRMAEIYQQYGDPDKARKLQNEADKLVNAVLKLYVPGQGVWTSLHRDNKKAEMRHVIDFIMVGKTLSNDLTPTTKKEMMNFVEKELLTKNWMRAQSLQDIAAANSDRPDHGPMGSYDAWPPLSMEVMCLFGEFDKALDFLHRTEKVTYEGPFAQSHEFLGKGDKMYLRIARRGQQNYNDGGAAFADVIVRSFFGFQPILFGDKPVVLSPNTPRGFNGKLIHIPFHNGLYAITSNTGGVKIKKEN
ncbi:MAG: hypothetical protein L3J11_03595 [Draconibacterium sp.]|nr:hypothetical protein [Draconibacterium sp.]